MSRLDRKLQAAGFSVRRFAYPSTAGQLDVHSRQLLEFCRQSRSDRMHFVAHSLGGLVCLHLLNQNPDLPPGRVVLMGSPLDGSSVARRSARLPGAGKLFGQVKTALEGGYGELPAGRETGMIAGTRDIGLGMLLGGAGKPGDGTVTVAETRTTGLKDHLLLPVTHTGLVFSSDAARQVICFLQTGSFDWPGAC
jgi:pimeloyl-ACP methyl ester carboxylesterase